MSATSNNASKQEIDSFVNIENAIRKIIVKKHNETVTLFMVRGEYNAVKQFIEDCDRRMREQCSCIKDY